MASTRHLTALGLLLFTTAACGGYPPPNDRLTASVAAARSAREVGAGTTSDAVHGDLVRVAAQASLHLKLADEEITKAKALMKDGDNERAEYILIRAKADAELSLSLAKEVTAKADAQAAEDQIKALQQNQ